MIANVPVLLYHSIAPFEASGIWLPKGRFENQIRWLHRNGFTSIRAHEIFSDNLSPKSVLITFDDAYDNVYEEGIPILQDYGFTATIFAISGYCGKRSTWDAGFSIRGHMNWTRLRELSDMGFEIDSHTHTHRDLTRLSREEIKMEMDLSRKTIQDQIGKPVRFLSYPFGRHTELVRNLAKDLEYIACFSSNPLVRHRWAIGRMGITFMDTMKEFRVKLHPESGCPYKIEGMKTNAINFLSKGTPLWKALAGANKKMI